MSKPQALILVLLVTIFLFRFISEPHFDPSLKSGNDSPEYFIELRQLLSGQINSLLPDPQSGLLNGIILGLKADLPPDFQQALKNTSTVHIVVASGQNLTILAGFILALAPFFGRKKAIILSITSAVFYTLLAGLQVPIIRAAIMVSVGGLAQLVNREVNSFWVLIFTALIMLSINPNWLNSVSFQLSFLATIGVLVVAPELLKTIKFVPDFIRQDLAVSFSAQILTAPVIAANFHQFSLVGLLANSLVLWTVPIIMELGMIGLVLSFIPFVNILAVAIPTILATYFIYVINFLNQDWASLEVGDINNWILIGYYFLALGLFLIIRQYNLRQLSSPS